MTMEEYEELFKKGTIVEVSSEDEGLRGSWYTATVLRTISRKTQKILVEYHNLMADDSCSKPLREFVNFILVRPIPPREPAFVFRAMDDVDAFHNDGWWEGVVTEVLGPSRYAVFFRCSREQIVFSGSDLRLHREWVGADQWVPPFEQHTQEKENGRSGEERGKANHSGNKKAVKMNGDERKLGNRSRKVPRKQDGVVNCNGREGRSSNCFDNKNAMTKKRKEREQRSSNGMGKKGGVTGNRKLKEPRRRASNHAGRRISKK